MRKIVHGLMLHVTMHFLCVMRQFLYDVLCIHIHVTVHWFVRNTANRKQLAEVDVAKRNLSLNASKGFTALII